MVIVATRIKPSVKVNEFNDHPALRKFFEWRNIESVTHLQAAQWYVRNAVTESFEWNDDQSRAFIKLSMEGLIVQTTQSKSGKVFEHEVKMVVQFAAKPLDYIRHVEGLMDENSSRPSSEGAQA